MKPILFTAIYAIFVGTLMILMWSFFIATSQVPEYNTRPAEITLHLIDEFLTAMLLVVSGIFALRKTKLGNLLLLPSIGMLLYSTDAWIVILDLEETYAPGKIFLS